MDRDGEWSDKEQIRCLSIEETEAFGENRGVRRWGGRQWWQKGRERGSVFVNLMYLISFAVSESSRGWSNSGSKERAGEREESRLMQQNKGAVAPRRSQCLFLHPPLPPPFLCPLSSFYFFSVLLQLQFNVFLNDLNTETTHKHNGMRNFLCALSPLKKFIVQWLWVSWTSWQNVLEGQNLVASV